MCEMSKSLECEANGGDHKWVADSSLDYKGRLPLRASTGAWKASLFIIAIEFGERLSYFGIASSLILYLTKVLHQELKTAARSVNYWAGVTTLMPLLGGFLADAYFGRYATVLLSSVIYVLGLTLLTMSAFVPSFKPCGGNDQVCSEARKSHEIIFFLAIYMISIGTGGHKPSLESFGADQFDDDHSEERKKKMSYFNWWNFGLCSGLLFGVTIIVYIQDHFGWGTADVILTAVLVVSVVIFIAGRPFYRYRKPSGSPLTPLLQVVVASIRKRKLPLPSNPSLLHEFPRTANNAAHGRFLCHTQNLKFLDKAAVYEDKGGSAEMQSPWRLATVTKVEEMKLILNMIPIWLATLPFGVTIAQTSTFFIKQAANLNRKMGDSLILPPTTIFCLTAIGMIVSLTIYDKLLVPMLRRTTGNERGINILQRIGIGMLFVIATMIIAALVEHKRLQVVAGNPKTGSLTMSVFWLAPQFLIIGFGDGFAIVGLQEYFYDQVPDSMRSLGIAFYLSVIGAGSFLSSLLITVVDDITRRTGKSSWFGKDLNSSRLDKFYWLLAAVSAANLCVYILIARRYSYKNVQRRVCVADCNEDEARENGESMA
ncbi:protein NRT1/ PTR FAMILY 5.6-like [Cucurbita maxima]|uniref:Protein NRT1/ PTR FAMILY 5.6-like n=1 Tax=Cucurbita maxima TaxID=3661 RepID=A0A6J1ILV8_CUCMA|nr:protein NRT1/ PTR FAMILY 5.6-like [Cucurbita maxima]